MNIPRVRYLSPPHAAARSVVNLFERFELHLFGRKLTHPCIADLDAIKFAAVFRRETHLAMTHAR